MEAIKKTLDESKELMNKAIEHTTREFNRIRAGKATPDMLDGVTVEAYGAQMTMSQVASVSAPDAKSLVIKPFDKSLLNEIEKAIKKSEMGLNPTKDADQIRINLPPLTEERRKALIKQAKAEAEAGKVAIRNIRKDINEALKKLKKDGISEDEIKRAEEQVQKLTDQFTTKVDEVLKTKETELLTV